MPNDRIKLNPIKINWDINFPSLPKEKEEEEKTYPLFHCYSCGIHPTVICETRPKGNSEMVQVRLINIMPNSQKIIEVLGDKLPSNVETFDILMCGNCGKVGGMENVPEFVLIMNGVITPVEEDVDKVGKNKESE